MPLILLITVCVGSVFGLWQLSDLSEEMTKATALESLAHESTMLEDVNTLYADVVTRAREGGAKSSHDYVGKKGVIPIPATFKQTALTSP